MPCAAQPTVHHHQHPPLSSFPFVPPSSCSLPAVAIEVEGERREERKADGIRSGMLVKLYTLGTSEVILELVKRVQSVTIVIEGKKEKREAKKCSASEVRCTGIVMKLVVSNSRQH